MFDPLNKMFSDLMVAAMERDQRVREVRTKFLVFFNTFLMLAIALAVSVAQWSQDEELAKKSIASLLFGFTFGAFTTYALIYLSKKPSELQAMRLEQNAALEFLKSWEEFERTVTENLKTGNNYKDNLTLRDAITQLDLRDSTNDDLVLTRDLLSFRNSLVHSLAHYDAETIKTYHHALNSLASRVLKPSDNTPLQG